MTSKAGFSWGVRVAGTGSAVPEKVLTNADLAEMMDTSDEWIRRAARGYRNVGSALRARSPRSPFSVIRSSVHSMMPE